jgi:hypothetical protein
MRKTLISLALLFSLSIAFSQTPLTQAVDFTATTTEGEQFNLFDVLAGGQYVCIDFFYTT